MSSAPDNVGAVLRQLRLAGLRGDRPQPAARRRHPRRRRSRRGPRRHPAPRPGQHARPASPPQPANPPCTCPPTGPAKSSGKPCGTTSSATRPRNPAPPDPTDPSLSTPPPQAGPEEPHKEKLVQASGSHMRQSVHAPAQLTKNRRRPLEIIDPRIQAKPPTDCPSGSSVTCRPRNPISRNVLHMALTRRSAQTTQSAWGVTDKPWVSSAREGL